MAHTATIPFSGRSLLCCRLKGAQSEPLNIGWGTGVVTGAANSDVNLFNPVLGVRTAGTSSAITTSQLADTYQVTGALTATSAITVTEAGLFTNTSAPVVATLAGTLTSGATSATLGVSIGPTAGNFFVQVENECLLVTGGQNTSLVTLSRGQLGSAAAGHVSGSAVSVGGDGAANATFGLGPATAVLGSGGTNQHMYLHCDFAGVALNSGDAILFTLQDQFSGA